MRLARAGAAFLLTSGAVTAVLAWAGWPRPAVRAVVPGAAEGEYFTLHEPRRPGLAWHGGRPDAHPRWLAVAVESPSQDGRTLGVFDRAAGVVRGPWPGPAAGGDFSHDPAGHLVTRPWHDFVGCHAVAPPDPLEVYRTDPATGAAARTVGPVPPADTLILSADASTAAVVATTDVRPEPGEPIGGFLSGFADFARRVRENKRAGLTVTVSDTADGRVRHRFDFPARSGSFGVFTEVLAATDIQLSPDGRRLAVAEAWNGLHRRGAGGVAVYDTHTGTLVRRVAHPDPLPAALDAPAARQTEDAVRHAKPGGPIPEPARVSDSAGAFRLRFDSTGGFLAYSLRRQVRGTGDDDAPEPAAAGVECGTDLATGEPLPAGHPLLALPPPNDADPVLTSADGTRTLSVNPERTAVRLTTSGTPGPWHPLPTKLAGRLSDDNKLLWLISGARFVPGTDTVVFHYSEHVPAETGWWADLRAWLGLTVRDDGRDDFFVLHTTATGTFEDLACISRPHTWLTLPGEVVFLDQQTGVLEVWPARPRREPWAWAVPAGLLAGAAAAYLAGRRRAKTPPPAVPVAG